MQVVIVAGLCSDWVPMVDMSKCKSGFPLTFVITAIPFPFVLFGSGVVF